jgi:UDP-N-acetylglucosamine:LPS N-acetylglucosamine transferase
MPETGLTPRSLAAALEPLMKNRQELTAMAEHARSVSVPDSADRVAMLCQEFLAA